MQAASSSSDQPDRSQLEQLLDDVKEPPQNPGRKLAELMERREKALLREDDPDLRTVTLTRQ